MDTCRWPLDNRKHTSADSSTVAKSPLQWMTGLLRDNYNFKEVRYSTYVPLWVRVCGMRAEGVA